MKLSKISTALLLALPAVVYATENNVAQVEDTSNQLDPITVTALRDASHYAKYANNISKVDAEQLERTQPTSVAKALQNLPNVDVAGGGRALAQKPSIRGLGDNRVVQVIDGVRQNFDLAHRGSYFVPMSLIREIEVVKGPSSTIWGSQALGGAVVMRTANALDLLKPNQKIGAMISQGYQSANEMSNTDLAVYGATESLDWLLQGQYSDSDNLRLAKGEMLPNSAYAQRAGLFKFGWQINDANRVELSHRISRSTQTAPGNNEARDELTYEQVANTIGQWHRQNRGATIDQIKAFYSGLQSELGSMNYLSNQKITDQSTSLNYYFNPESPYLNGRVTVYHNQTLEQESRVATGLKDETKLKTTGFNIINSSDLNWMQLSYGVDYYQDRAKTQRNKDNTNGGKFRPNNYDAKSNSVGAYVVAHLPIWQDHILLSPSIRYDYFNAKNEGQKQSDHHWSPAVALTFKATDWLDITAKYNQAFRAPSLQERFVSGAHFGLSSGRADSINTFIANPDLKPEVAKNKEVNARVHFNDLIANKDKFEFSATYFQNDVKDFINLEVFQKNPNNPWEIIPLASQYRNVSKARLKGFELVSQYEWNGLGLNLSYGQTRGKDRNTGDNLANISADKLGIGVQYQIIPESLTLATQVNRYSAQRRLPADNKQNYDGYTLVGVSFSYVPTIESLRDFRVDFAIDNLFDKKNIPAFSLTEDAGRNAKVNVSYKF